MKKIICLLIIIYLFLLTSCNTVNNKVVSDNTKPSKTLITTPSQFTTSHSNDKHEDIIDDNVPFDPSNLNQPDVIKVRNAFINATQAHGYLFDVGTIGAGWSDESDVEYFFSLAYDDIVQTRRIKISVYAIDGTVQSWFDVHLDSDYEDELLKDVIECSIYTIAPEVSDDQVEMYLSQMVEGFSGKGRSNVIEINGYNLHISNRVLDKEGTGIYRGWPILHVVSKAGLAPTNNPTDYHPISPTMNLRELSYITGVIERFYEKDGQYVMEVSDGASTCGIYYMQDKFAGCFEIGKTYTFFGQFAGQRDGFSYSIKLDGYQ